MISSVSRFLIDSNSLITPFKRYYPFDFARNFWDQLIGRIGSNEVIVLDLVKEEILKGDDDLSTWMSSIPQELILDRRAPDIMVNYSLVINYIRDSGVYKDSALSSWSQPYIADPWLIATAKTYGLTVVTFETPNGCVPANQKAGKVKIPDVCDALDVRCKDLFYMMRELSFVI